MTVPSGSTPDTLAAAVETAAQAIAAHEFAPTSAWVAPSYAEAAITAAAPIFAAAHQAHAAGTAAERERIAVLAVALDEIAALCDEPQSRLVLARIALGGAGRIARLALDVARAGTIEARP